MQSRSTDCASRDACLEKRWLPKSNHSILFDRSYNVVLPVLFDKYRGQRPGNTVSVNAVDGSDILFVRAMVGLWMSFLQNSLQGWVPGVLKRCSMPQRLQKWTTQTHSFSKNPKFSKSVHEKYFFGSVKVDGNSGKQKIMEFSSLKIKVLLQKLSQPREFPKNHKQSKKFEKLCSQ